MGSFAEDNTEAMAFILVIAAGLATGIGASVVFFPKLASLANRKVLAIALGLAAGVMLYISLVDIYGKSIEGYGESHVLKIEDEDGNVVLDDAGDPETEPNEGKAFILATITYFCGCILMLLLDKFVDFLIHWTMKRGSDSDAVAAGFYGSATGSTNAVEDLEKMRANFEEKQASVKASEMGKAPDASAVEAGDEEAQEQAREKGSEAGTEELTEMDTTKEETAVPLKHMSWTMFLAIAIHNFPEGMVTYIAYVDDAAVGAALAIGIAIHNIPEGLCVAMPMFYATGRRTYSFFMGTLSGLTEVIGGLIAWLVLKQDLGGNANGALFGLVAGMMSVISIQELLPTAHKYAEDPNTVTYAFLFGAFMIALSLMLFGG